MAIDDFFRHECDIYAKIETSAPLKFGVQANYMHISYNESPTYSNVPCLFGGGAPTTKPSMNEPVNIYEGDGEISLPADTIINRGDKVVDLRFGLEYTAGFPESIRGKYVSVVLYRKTGQGWL